MPPCRATRTSIDESLRDSRALCQQSKPCRRYTVRHVLHDDRRRRRRLVRRRGRAGRRRSRPAARNAAARSTPSPTSARLAATGSRRRPTAACGPACRKPIWLRVTACGRSGRVSAQPACGRRRRSSETGLAHASIVPAARHFEPSTDRRGMDSARVGNGIRIRLLRLDGCRLRRPGGWRRAAMRTASAAGCAGCACGCGQLSCGSCGSCGQLIGCCVGGCDCAWLGHKPLQLVPMRLEVRIQPLLDLVQIRIDDLMNFGREHRVRFVQQRDDVSARSASRRSPRLAPAATA